MTFVIIRSLCFLIKLETSIKKLENRKGKNRVHSTTLRQKILLFSSRAQQAINETSLSKGFQPEEGSTDQHAA